jgi:hypothetical protein
MLVYILCFMSRMYRQASAGANILHIRLLSPESIFVASWARSSGSQMRAAVGCEHVRAGLDRAEVVDGETIGVIS